MNTQTATTTTVPPTKFSRYRSVRKVASPGQDEANPPVPQADATLINRAPSRYRRPTVSRPQDAPALPVLSKSPPTASPPPKTTTSPQQLRPAAPTSPEQINAPVSRRHEPSQPRQRSDDDAGVPREPTSGTATAAQSRYHNREHSRAPSASARPMTAQSRTYDAAREEARMILEGEYDRLQKLKEVQKAHAKKLKAAQEAQAARDAKAAQEAEAIAHAQAAAEAKAATLKRQNETARDYEAIDNLDASARHKVDKFVDAPKAQVVRRPTQKHNRFITAPQNMVREQVPKFKASEDYRPSTAAPVQATFDAPVSAVNAGERRVEVRMNGADHGINLPVTPTTNARDLLNSASVVMSESVDPRTAILVESFAQFGLERPLRRYEHIRDVMNSWDMDSQNYLVIMSESECSATGLEKKEAPTTQPGDTELSMYHSCKPGKWEKRWIILRADGQVTMSKRENDGDATNICHLSDFDVYTPTRKETKKLRPPKKICFAVKSQQKSAMFLEGTNFIHFFTTGDKQVADQWYTAVQSWRSWYLANVLGEATPQLPSKEAARKQDVRPVSTHSHDSIPYQLGSFQPLLNLDFGEMKFNESGNVRTSIMPNYSGGPRRSADMVRNGELTRYPSRHTRGIGGAGSNGGPPSSFSTKLLDEARNRYDLGVDLDGQAFTGGGLLGRSMSRKSQHGNSHNRNQSQNHNQGHHHSYSYGQNQSSNADDQAFTGGGLLARSTSRRTLRGQPPNGGNGVNAVNSTNPSNSTTNTATNNVNNTNKPKPLVNLSETSEFTDGSLLRQLETWIVKEGDTATATNGAKRYSNANSNSAPNPHEPKIDRGKYIEADVKVGEGV